MSNKPSFNNVKTPKPNTDIVFKRIL